MHGFLWYVFLVAVSKFESVSLKKNSYLHGLGLKDVSSLS